MDIAKEIADKEGQKLQLVNQINAMEQQKQSIIQEIFRIEGEIRLLQRIGNNGQKEVQP